MSDTSCSDVFNITVVERTDTSCSDVFNITVVERTGIADRYHTQSEDRSVGPEVKRMADSSTRPEVLEGKVSKNVKPRQKHAMPSPPLSSDSETPTNAKVAVLAVEKLGPKYDVPKQKKGPQARRKLMVEKSKGKAEPEKSESPNGKESPPKGFALHNISVGEDDARLEFPSVGQLFALHQSEGPEINDDDGKVSVPKSKTVRDVRPTTLKMMEMAIQNINDKRGTSISAIKKWIVGTYPETEMSRLNTAMKKALQNGMENGFFVRPKDTPAAAQLWLTGRLRLGTTNDTKIVSVPKPTKQSKKEAIKVKSLTKSSRSKRASQENINENVAEASESSSEKPKPTKKTAKKSAPRSPSEKENEKPSKTKKGVTKPKKKQNDQAPSTSKVIPGKKLPRKP